VPDAQASTIGRTLHQGLEPASKLSVSKASAVSANTTITSLPLTCFTLICQSEMEGNPEKTASARSG
jgi:hypothetical protein